MKIQKINKTTYLVLSDTSENKYKVIVTKGDCICGCKGYVFRKECKHSKAVYEKLNAFKKSKSSIEKVKAVKKAKANGLPLSVYENQIRKQLGMKSA